MTQPFAIQKPPVTQPHATALPPQVPCRRPSRLEWLAAGSVALALLWVFFPTLVILGQRWWEDSRYSHGFLVPLFAAYLLYRRDRLTMPVYRPHWWGVLLIAAGLATHAAGTFIYFDWLNAVALLPCLLGFTVLLGGWAALKWAWPAIAFLAFMVPLPFWLETGLAQPLRYVGTVASCYTLQTLGFSAYSESNIIYMGTDRIGVEEACSGLSMLMTFFALSVAVALIVRRPLWERLLLVASAIPIALISNISRIIVTAMMHKVSHYWADLIFHNLAGYLMPVLALGLLLLELRLVAWVFPTREVLDRATITRRSMASWDHR